MVKEIKIGNKGRKEVFKHLILKVMIVFTMLLAFSSCDRYKYMEPTVEILLFNRKSGHSVIKECIGYGGSVIPVIKEKSNDYKYLNNTNI